MPASTPRPTRSPARSSRVTTGCGASPTRSCSRRPRPRACADPRLPAAPAGGQDLEGRLGVLEAAEVRRLRLQAGQDGRLQGIERLDEDREAVAGALLPPGPDDPAVGDHPRLHPAATRLP